MSSEEFNPIAFPQVWDVVTIGNVSSPGICQVGEAKRAAEWDVKKGKGTYGATVTYVGKPPAKVSIKFFLWEEQHFTDWGTFRQLFQYTPTKKAVNAIDIYHPSLADIALCSVVCEAIGNIIPEGKGMFSCTVDLLEYSPPPKKSAVGTPSGSTTAADGSTPGAKPDPIADAQQKEIAKLLAVAEAP